MSADSSTTPPFFQPMAMIPWQEFPGHFGGALSKALVGPDTCDSKRIDFRISCYQPMAFVEEHVHRIQEQVYYVLDGEGLLTLNGERVLMRKDDYVFVPPGVRHGFTNHGVGPLVFFVVTTPVQDGESAL